MYKITFTNSKTLTIDEKDVSVILNMGFPDRLILVNQNDWINPMYIVTIKEIKSKKHLVD